MRVSNRRWEWCLLGFWLFASVAGAATGDQLFAQGVGAFRNGNYQSAVAYFRQALASGLEQPSLYFNLGASLYKLGRFTEAEEAFRSCARDPVWVSLGSYNAGLSAYRRGDRAAAAGYFERAWRTADSDEVAALALSMLERVDTVASPRPRATLTVDIGYNDNVTLSSDGQTLLASSKSDHFFELLASATGRWGWDTPNLRWDASLYKLQYNELSDANITSVMLGASTPSKIASWHANAGAQWEYVLRHGQPFQQIGSLRFVVLRNRPNHGDLRLTATLSTIDARDDNFAFLDGSRQIVELSLGQRLAGGETRFAVGIERNNRADLATVNEFFSFSPQYFRLAFSGTWPLTGYWRFETSARFSKGRYADADRRVGGVVATREDDEYQLTLRATYKLTQVWSLFGDYTYVNNRSNFPEFAYSQRIVSLGANRPF